MFCEVMANTKRLSSETAKPPAIRYAASGFAFVPHTCRFLGQQSLGIELAVKYWWCGFFTFRPQTSDQRKGGRPARPLELSALVTVGLRKREAPTPLCRGLVFNPTAAIQGRAATALPDAGVSEAVVRRCRD